MGRVVAGFVVAVLVLACAGLGLSQAPPLKPVPTGPPAPPEVTAQLAQTMEHARQRFEARDAAGVLAHVSEQYRSAGLGKAAVRQQLLAMFGVHEAMRARVTLDETRVVDGGILLVTTGEVSGRLPYLGWVTLLGWEREPEIARREGAAWRLIGFQD
jgi:hypothetical protein